MVVTKCNKISDKHNTRKRHTRKRGKCGKKIRGGNSTTTTQTISPGSSLSSSASSSASSTKSLTDFLDLNNMWGENKLTNKNDLVESFGPPINLSYTDIQNKYLFNDIRSNYQYFALYFHDYNFQNIIDRICNSHRDLVGPSQEGGGSDDICDGNMIYDTSSDELKKHFFNLGRMKFHMDRQHDFKGDKRFNDSLEKKIFENYENFLDYLDKTLLVGDTHLYKDLYTTMMDKYNQKSDKYQGTSSPKMSFNLNTDVREHFYFLSIIDFLQINCSIINSLNITKYSSDQEFIKLKAPDLVFDFDDASQGNSDPGSEDEEMNAKKYYMSTIENEKIDPLFSEDDVNFAFLDNNITHKILYPLSLMKNPKSGNENEITSDELDIFTTSFKNGIVNTVASFLDPANRSKSFRIHTTIPHFKIVSDIANSITTQNNDIQVVKSRVQATQHLNEALSFYTVDLLSKGFDDYFQYFGSFLRVDFKEITQDMKDDMNAECIKYLKTGQYNETKFNDGSGSKLVYPIRFISDPTDPDKIYGVEIDVINNLKGAEEPKTTISMYVGDTTIDSILQHVNGKPVDGSVSARLDNIAEKIYESIPPRTQNELGDETDMKHIIILTLKAFGDTLQINYSKRLNDFLKNKEIMVEDVGIRSTDKNVFAESLLLDLPVWSTNNGINTNKEWMEEHKIIDKGGDWKGIKMFITNYNSNNDRLYYVSLFKTIQKLRNKTVIEQIQSGGENIIDCVLYTHEGKPLWGNIELTIEDVLFELQNNNLNQVKDDHYFIFNEEIYQVGNTVRSEPCSGNICDLSEYNGKKLWKANRVEAMLSKLLQYPDVEVGHYFILDNEVYLKSGEKNGEKNYEKVADCKVNAQLANINNGRPATDAAAAEFDVDARIADILEQYKDPSAVIIMNPEIINTIREIVNSIMGVGGQNPILSKDGIDAFNNILNNTKKKIHGNDETDFQNTFKKIDVFLRDILDIYENIFGVKTLNSMVDKYNNDMNGIIDSIHKEYIEKIKSLLTSQQKKIFAQLRTIKYDPVIFNIFTGMEQTKQYVNDDIKKMIDQHKATYEKKCHNLSNSVQDKLENSIKDYIRDKERGEVIQCIREKYNEINNQSMPADKKNEKFKSVYKDCYTGKNIDDDFKNEINEIVTLAQRYGDIDYNLILMDQSINVRSKGRYTRTDPLLTTKNLYDFANASKTAASRLTTTGGRRRRTTKKHKHRPRKSRKRKKSRKIKSSNT